MGTRRDLRERFRTRMGFPEDTSTGNNRFNAALNSALRHLWSDMPDALLSEELRFTTEADVTVAAKVQPYNNSNTSVFDPLVFVVLDQTESARLPPAEEVRGRWFEYTDDDGKQYVRRVQDLFHAEYKYNPNGTGEITVASAAHIVVDLPYHGTITTSKALEWRIFTKEYPYPENVQKIINLIYDPDNTGSNSVIPMLRGDQDRHRRSIGWRSTGTPRSWARGDFFQLPGPRYSPSVYVDQTLPNEASTNAYRWGFDASGNEHGTSGAYQPKYGAAGTFSYKIVHVWGRRPRQTNLNENDRSPWYISSASESTPQISTVWGGPYIEIRTPNLDATSGYHPDTTKPSLNKFGVEKWIFRARHAVSKTKNPGSTGPVVQDVPSDGVYYLWKIVPGYETSTIDRGDEDPPDKRFSLESWHGHQSIRFDRLPTSAVPVLIHCVKRPPQLHHDHDTPRVPEEAIDALFALVASFLSGDRDGSMERKQLYLAEYAEHRKRLIRMMGLAAAVIPTFGDGLGVSGTHRSFVIDDTVESS